MTSIAKAFAHQKSILSDSPFLEKLGHSIAHPVFVLNQDQVVVFANSKAKQWLGIKGNSEAKEFRLENFLPEKDWGFEDNSEEILVQGEKFLLVTFQDQGKDEQRQQLERTFFHDLLNTAGGIMGISNMIPEATAEELPSLAKSVQGMANQLVEEIFSQRDLLAAESGELQTNTRQLSSLEILETTKATCLAHCNFSFREIELASAAESFFFTSDPTLLGRILTNMVKNALEACREPDVVTLNCGRLLGNIWFSVHNPGYIAEEIQPQIFQQSFSTKGTGRGTGTFSMKLFAEQYLGGQVDFESNPDGGTVFILNLPFDDS